MSRQHTSNFKMHRTRRNVPRKDYAEMHHGRGPREDFQVVVNNSDREESFDYSNSSEEGVSVAHKEDDEALFSDSTLDMEIDKALWQEDSDRTQVLLNEKERWCGTWKKEWKKEKSKEDEMKKKRLKQMESRFHKLKKTEQELNQSLASSRSSTPVSSPAKSPRYNRGKPAKRLSEGRRAKATFSKKKMSPGRRSLGNRSEYEHVLSSILDCKTNTEKSNKFNELLYKAMSMSKKARVKHRTIAQTACEI